MKAGKKMQTGSATLKATRKLRREQILAGIAAAVVSTHFVAEGASASTWYWNDAVGNNTWSTSAANWNSNSTGSGGTAGAPTSAGTDYAVLNASASNPSSQTISLSAFQLVAGLTYNDTGATTIQNTSATAYGVEIGSGGLTVGASAGALTFASTTANPFTVDLISSTNAETWTNNSAYALTVGGLLSYHTPATAAIALTLAGTGSFNFLGQGQYTGGTTISAVSTLQYGNGNAGNDGYPSSTGGITDNGTLTYDYAGTMTYAGAITGSGLVTKTGPGTVILTGSNSYGGTTTISNGTLALSGGSLNGSNVTVNGSSAYLTESTSGAITGTGTTFTVDSGTATFLGANKYTGATTISGGVLNIGSASSLGSSSYSSGVTVASGGALQIQNSITTNAAVPLTINGTGVTALPAGALDNVSGNNTYTGLLALGGNATIESDSGTLTLNNTGVISGTNTNLTLAGAGNGVIDGSLSLGSGGITMGGTGTFILSGANLGSGNITINGGILQAYDPNKSSTASGPYAPTVNPLGASNTLYLNAGTLQLRNNGALSASTTAVEAFGTAVVVGGAGTIDIARASSSTYNTLGFQLGALSIGAGDSLAVTSPSAQQTNRYGLAFSGTTTLTATAGGTSTIYANEQAYATVTGINLSAVTGSATSGTDTLVMAGNYGSGTFTYAASINGTISDGTFGGNLALDVNAGESNYVLGLSGASSSYTGGTTLTAGTVKLLLAATTPFGTGSVVFDGGTLDLDEESPTIYGLSSTVNGGTITDSHTYSTGGAVSVLTDDQAGSTSFGGLIRDGTYSTPAPVGLAMTGSGTLVLASSNSYSGGNTVSAGTLVAGNTSAFGATTGTLSVSGGTVDIGTFSPTVGVVNLNGGTIQSTGSTTATLTGSYYVMQAGTISANLAGASVPMLKTSAGSVFLSGSNTYGGGTTISAGTLVANTTGGSATGSGTVSIGANSTAGTLAGSGQIAGAVTVYPGGTITAGSGATPSDSVGTLTLNSTANQLQGGGTYVAKVAGTSSVTGNDEIVVNGLSFGVGNSTQFTIALTSVSGSLNYSGAPIVLIDDLDPSSANPFGPALAGYIPQEFTLTVNGITDTGPSPIQLGTQPDGTTGYDLIVTAPEPTGLALLSIMSAPMILRRRRRQASVSSLVSNG